MEKSFNIAKTDEDQRLVFGWASVAYNADGEQLVDHQGDMIEPEDMEEAAYKFVLKFRDTGEEHIPTMRKKGKLVESVVFTKEKQRAMGIPDGILPIGWWVGFHIDDDAAWQKIKSGKYKMFSVEGKGVRTPIEKSCTFFDEIEKFNPYHDRLGRFASAGGAASFTYKPGKSKAHDLAIQREKERLAQSGNGGKKEETTRRGNRRFSDKDCGDAIIQYTGSGYRGVRRVQSGNDSIYSKEDKAKYKEMGEKVEEFIKDPPPYGAGTLYRGINVSPDVAKQFKKGTVVSMNGTSSWTESEKVADEFAGFGGSRCVFISTGTKMGKSIAEFSDFPQEKEVCVSRDARYRINNVKKKNGTNYFYCEEIV